MKPKNTIYLVIALILALIISLGCAVSTDLSTQEEPPPTDPPPPPEPTVTEAPAERVQLDPCALLTEEEVEAVLGGPVEIQPSMGTGGCVYLLQTDDPAAMVQLVLSAAQGNEAKAFTVLSLGLLAGFSGDPEIQSGFEELNSQLPDLTLLETVSRMAELFRGTGVSLVQADGPGEHASWLVYESEFYSQGTLILVRGEEYVSISQIGGEMTAAFDQLGNLGRTVFDRLPESFYTLDEDGDGSFSMGIGGEETLPTAEPEPTVPPEPTEPPTEGCVPVMLSPLEGETLDNGCLSKTEPRVWEFEWSACPGAQSYHLYVIGPGATFPIVDDQTPNTTYVSQGTGYIADQNRVGWKWMVRAMQNGVWGEWSAEILFDAEPVNTDCP